MDFTKGIATEVRFLLQEIGRLRDERRQLQAYVYGADLSGLEADHICYEAKSQSLCRLGRSSVRTESSSQSGGFQYLYVLSIECIVHS